MSGRPVILSSYGGSEAYAKQIYDAVGISELRIPVKMVNISRSFGPYTGDMFWAQPDHGAAVYAMRQVHMFTKYYRNMSSIVRLKLLGLLSPVKTGKLMKHRLDQISYCACILSNQNNIELCADFQRLVQNLDHISCINDLLGKSAVTVL